MAKRKRGPAQSPSVAKRRTKVPRPISPESDTSNTLATTSTASPQQPLPNLKIFVCGGNKARQAELDFAKNLAGIRPTRDGAMTMFCDGSLRIGPGESGGFAMAFRDPHRDRWTVQGYRIDDCPWIQHAEMAAIVEAVATAAVIRHDADNPISTIRVFTDSDTCLLILRDLQQGIEGSRNRRKFNKMRECLEPFTRVLTSLVQNELADTITEIRYLPRCSDQ